MPAHTAQTCVMPHRDGQPRRTLGELLLCAGHHHALTDTLTPQPDRLTLAQLYDQLATLLPGRPTTSTGPVSGSHNHRLPLNPTIADIRIDIRHTLASWARIHTEELHTTPPGGDEPAAVAPFLARYVDWSAAQPWIDDYLGELAELRRRAWNAYDLTRIRSTWTVGPCYLPDPAHGTCPGMIRVVIREQRDDSLATTVACTADPEHTWTPEQWTRLGRRLKAA